MPLLTFYSLNPAKLERYEPYLNAWLEEQKATLSEAGWTNGLYVGRAIGTAFSKSAKYPDSPLELYRTVEPDGDDDEGPAQKFTDADRFGAWAAMFNKSREAKTAKEADSEGAKQTVELSKERVVDTDGSANDRQS